MRSLRNCAGLRSGDACKGDLCFDDAVPAAAFGQIQSFVTGSEERAQVGDCAMPRSGPGVSRDPDADRQSG